MKRRTKTKRVSRWRASEKALAKAIRIADRDPAYSGLLGRKSIFDHPEVQRAMRKRNLKRGSTW